MYDERNFHAMKAGRSSSQRVPQHSPLQAMTRSCRQQAVNPFMLMQAQRVPLQASCSHYAGYQPVHASSACPSAGYHVFMPPVNAFIQAVNTFMQAINPVHAGCQHVHAGCQFCFCLNSIIFAVHELDRSRSPTMVNILLVIIPCT